MSAQYNQRVVNIESILLIQNLNINETSLRQCCAYGIPDKFRPLIWRLFLGYLPGQRDQWAPLLNQQRKHYANLVESFVETAIPSVSEITTLVKLPESCKNADNEEKDHPLAIEHNSQWTGYFRDNELLKQIENDVRRLRPEIDFFQRQTFSLVHNIPANLRLSKRLNRTKFSSNECAAQIDTLTNKSFISDYMPATNLRASRRCTASLPTRKNSNKDQRMKNNSFDEEDSEKEKHWEVVERMLFIYSKVNTAVKYVQGIHEILGPIYFVLATDSDREWSMHAEADSFFCFHNLMVELQDIFIRKMDRESCGIAAALAHFCASLADNDPVLYRHLEQQQMKPEYYGFRWLSLLLSQEFSLPDVIAIWDTVFCSPAGKRLLSVEYICLAMLEMLRDQLLEGDFQNNLKLLQNFPEHIDVFHLVIRSLEISNGLTWRMLQQQKGNTKSRFAKFTSNNNDGNDNNNNKKRILGMLTDASTIKARITKPLRGLVADTAAKFQRSNNGNSNNRKENNNNSIGGAAKFDTSTKEEQLLRNATL